MNLATCATHQHGDRNGVLDRVRVHGRNLRADMEGVKAPGPLQDRCDLRRRRRSQFPEDRVCLPLVGEVPVAVAHGRRTVTRGPCRRVR